MLKKSGSRYQSKKSSFQGFEYQESVPFLVFSYSANFSFIQVVMLLVINLFYFAHMRTI